MIRSIQEHYDLIVATKEGKASLGELQPIGDSAEDFVSEVNSGSKTAIWRRFVWIFAVHAWVMDVLFDAHKKEVETKLANQIFGTFQWYKEITLAFQYGYQLEWNGKRYDYPDTTSQAALDAQIIKRCAVVQVENQLQFKVAKLENDAPVKLAIAEKNALQDYLFELGYPGTNIVVISEDPDEIKFELDVYYNPQVMADDGSLINDPTTFPVKDAINNYIQNLDWNGKVYESQMMDGVQSSEGVEDFQLKSIQVKYGNLAYVDLQRVYIPFAGHMKIDEDASIINYIEQV